MLLHVLSTWRFYTPQHWDVNNKLRCGVLENEEFGMSFYFWLCLKRYLLCLPVLLHYAMLMGCTHTLTLFQAP